MACGLPIAASIAAMPSPRHGTGGGAGPHVTAAWKPSWRTDPSDVNCTVMAAPVEAAPGGVALPWRRAIRVAAVVAPSWTLTKSKLASVWKVAKLMVGTPVGQLQPWWWWWWGGIKNGSD